MCRTKGGNNYEHDAACFRRWSIIGKVSLSVYWGLWLLAVLQQISWPMFFAMVAPFVALMVSGLWFTRRR